MNSIHRRLNYNYIKFILPAYSTKIYLTRDILYLPEDYKLRVNINGHWCSPFFPHSYSYEKGKLYFKILNHSFGLDRKYECIFIYPCIDSNEYYSEVKDDRTINRITMQPQINLYH